jgi:hypothetical protein
VVRKVGECPREYLKETHSDSLRGISLGQCPRLMDQSEPSKEFDMKEPTWNEVKDSIRKARSKSAPGPIVDPVTRSTRNVQNY